MKPPKDRTPYPKDSRSSQIQSSTPDGGYVYVQDLQGVVHILPDAPHVHPLVLGGGQAALYAGDLTIQGGKVIDVTNLSGTFQFDSEEGLLAAADAIEDQGMEVVSGAVRFFPSDGSYPIILR